ncbi:flavin reductase family protein [Chloroflexota bacterium]
MKLNPNNMENQDIARLLHDVVVPRPIAWVSTVDEHGIYNLAPFSAYSMIGGKPPLICFSIGTPRNGQKKDTILNIEFTNEFVISVVTDELAEAMNNTSASYPRNISEYEEARVTPVKAEIVKVPMVRESPVNMECKVIQILKFGKAPILRYLIIGEILIVHIADELYDEQTRRISGLKAVGRLGGDGDIYCHTGDTFQMKRPTL